MKYRKPYYKTVTAFFISRNGLTSVGIRDTYKDGKYIFSKVSTAECPKWSSHALNQLRTPLVPFFETMSTFEKVGEI